MSLETFLAGHSDADWLQILFKLEPRIHQVDRRATRIWFAFFPLKLYRAWQGADDKKVFERDLILKGNYLLADQIDDSAHFLYGHRYWPQVKAAVANHAATSGSTDPVQDQVLQLASQVAAQVSADVSVLVGITAVAFMTLVQTSLSRMEEPAVVTRSHAKSSADEVLRKRNAEAGHGLFSFLRSVDKRFSVTFDEDRSEAKFKVVNMQDITMAAAEDKRPHHLSDPRCREGEGPIPVECRTCACGTCWVGVLSDTSKLSAPASREIDKVTNVFGYEGFAKEKDSPIRMACQVKCYGNVSIVIPPWHGVLHKLKKMQTAAAGQD